MGAWIETFKGGKKMPPVRVAPLVGAWIETIENANKKHKSEVAPLVGAWIETSPCPSANNNKKMSLPSWERGLKLKKICVDYKIEIRRSPRGSVD